MPGRVTCFLLTFFIGVGAFFVWSEEHSLHSFSQLSSAQSVSQAAEVCKCGTTNYRIVTYNYTSAASSAVQAGYSLDRMRSFILGLLSITQNEDEESPADTPKNNSRKRSSSSAPHKKYVLITRGPARVLEELNPKSPILGMAKRGAHYPLLKAGDSWCTIMYDDREGWIERQYIDIVDATSSSFVLREFLTIAGIIIGIVIIIALIYLLSSRSNKMKAEWFSTTETVKKKIVIVSQVDTQVQRVLTNNITPLEKCFTEIGFETKISNDSNTTMKLIYHYLPDAIAVDWQLGGNTQAVMEQILASKSFTNNMFVLFYNVPDPATVEPSRVIPNVHYLGISFSDRDLFNVITPIIITGEKKHTIRKSIESTALQGDITESNLMDVLQFVEIGRKTGCLLIEVDKKPIGIVYFNDGIIIYAATRLQTGKKAVFDILNFLSGQFYFVLDKKPKSPNCSIPIVGILMEWTKEADETSGNRLRQA